MFKRTLTTLAAAVLSFASAAQAFPSSAVEGSESRLQTIAGIAASTANASITAAALPSSGVEGSEMTIRSVVAAPRNVQNSYAGSLTSVFPELSME